MPVKINRAEAQNDNDASAGNHCHGAGGAERSQSEHGQSAAKCGSSVEFTRYEDQGHFAAQQVTQHATDSGGDAAHQQGGPPLQTLVEGDGDADGSENAKADGIKEADGFADLVYPAVAEEHNQSGN